MAHVPQTASLKRWIVIVVGLFATQGLVTGMWGGSLPSVRDRIGTDERGISWLLMLSGLVAIVCMQIAGRLSDVIGPKYPSFIGGAFVVAAAVGVGVSDTYTELAITSAILGVGHGALDVSMNTMGIAVEKRANSPIMSRFHACWSLGSFVGSGLVFSIGRAIGARQQVVTPIVTAVLAAIMLTILFMLTPTAHVQHDEHAEAGGRRQAPRIPTVAYLLGIMAACVAFTEGAAADWSALHVTDVAKVSASFGAIGLVAAMGPMVIVRFGGDAIVVRWGRTRLVQVFGVVAALGYVVAVVAHWLPVILLGWALVGIGVGAISPQIYAIAGHLGGGKTLALVTGFGFGGMLIGPGIIGLLAHSVGLQQSMLLPLVLAIVVAVLAVTPMFPGPAHEK